MDLATLIGFILGVSIVTAAIMAGGPLTLFIDGPFIAIVFGGMFGVSLMRILLADFFISLTVAAKAFINKSENAGLVIEEAVRLAEIAQKIGLLALGGEPVTHPFFKKGHRFMR